MSTAHSTVRNPGPSWGYGFLLWAESWWPRWIFRPAFMLGTWVALPFMPEPRRHSRAYLALVLGRPVRLIEVWRHFFAFADFLMLKLRVGRGVKIRCDLAPENAAAFNALADSAEPALFGTFHFGCSDLLGYLLGERGRQIAILRLRVDNSDDTYLLGRRFGEHAAFLWINDPASLVFELKAAFETGISLAMKCDRLEFSAKTEPFRFLGAARKFPFTIYHLAVLTVRPVVFCVALPGAEADTMLVYASQIYRPEARQDRAENLRRARAHFQDVLTSLETLVHRQPFLWFNFLPMNPAQSDGSAAI